MSHIVEIEIPNLPALKQAFRDYEKISEPILERAIHASAAILAKHSTRPTVPFRTGRLIQSFVAQFGRLQARWSPTVRYAIYVHEGTRPHIILPRIKKALWWEGALHPVRRVQHPGTKANPFMQRIANQSQPEIEGTFVQALDLINREIANRTNIR